MNSPLVSIVVPLYNQRDYIQEAIDSVRNQSYPNWELIIMDDGSTDDGKQIVLDVKKYDQRIFLYTQQNSGPSITRNEAILRSTGKYILPLDGDDKIAPTYIEKAVEYLESHPNCKLVYCKAEKFGAESGSWPLPEYKYENLLWENMIFCTAMFRRSDYDKTIGYNPNMVLGLEDWDFWLSLLSPEDEVHRIEEVLFYYRIKSISRTTELSPRYDEATRQIYRNHTEIYKSFAESTINTHNVLRYKDMEISRILNSKTFKAGWIVTAPYRFIKKLFKH